MNHSHVPDTSSNVAVSSVAGEAPIPLTAAETAVLQSDDAIEGYSEDALPDVPAADADIEPGLARVASGPAYTVFSRRTIRWIIMMVAISSSFSPMTANIYFPVLNSLAEAMGVSVALINITLTTYMVCQGIGPTLIGDFGDAAGRRPAFLVAISVYIAANIGLALQTNYAALLILRMVQALGSSGTLALGFAVAADISVPAERGSYMGFIGIGINVGPAISPIIGGVLSQYLGWRAIFWFCAIFTGVWLVPYALAVPETCRKVVGNGSIKPRGWNVTLLDYIRFKRMDPALVTADQQHLPRQKIPFPNPLRAVEVILQKDMALILLLNSVINVVHIIIISTLSTIIHRIYGFDDLQVGLYYIPYGVGCCVASVIQGLILDTNYKRIARKIGFTIDLKRGDDLSKFPIEKARIQPILPMLSIGLAIGIGYGWALEYKAHFAVPLVLLFFMGVGICGSFSITNTLIVDLYPQAPATAIAAGNLSRCLLGAGVMAFIEPMLLAIGAGWTFTFWMLLCAAMIPILFVIQRFGPRWREERRLRLLQAERRPDTGRQASQPGMSAEKTTPS